MADPITAYVLLDISASMHGAPLEALKQGVQLLFGTLISRSKHPVQVCLISYESTANVLLPLQTVLGMEIPRLEAAGSSGLGGALRLLAQTLGENDQPLLYIFTDGQPTDDWEEPVENLRPRLRATVAILCGLAASPLALRPLVDFTFQMRDLTPDLLFDTFRGLL